MRPQNMIYFVCKTCNAKTPNKVQLVLEHGQKKQTYIGAGKIILLGGEWDCGGYREMTPLVDA